MSLLTSQGFTKSLAMTILSEVGDRTFCVAAIAEWWYFADFFITFCNAKILAMRYPRKSVLLGCLVSVIMMTILSALVGWVAPNLVINSIHLLIPCFVTASAGLLAVLLTTITNSALFELFLSEKWANYITTLLYFTFGLRSMWDGFTEDDDDNEELEEVEKELENDLKASAQKSKEASKDDENVKKKKKPFLTHFFSPVFLKAFSLTFFGEWGDKSQLATIGLAADEDTLGVVLGGILGQVLCTVAAVLGGRSLASKISERMVSILGGSLSWFLVFCQFFHQVINIV